VFEKSKSHCQTSQLASFFAASGLKELALPPLWFFLFSLLNEMARSSHA